MAKNKMTAEPDQPPEDAEPLPPPPKPDGSPVEGREVALFVCVVCGKEKRGQKHYNFACDPCVSLR
jgi:hypothetical protein